MVTIADKINLLLTQRGFLKRDLARALGISPQTATDICKGRSAVTLPHLRKLIGFFNLRADFWMDDDRLEPSAADDLMPALNDKLKQLVDIGLLQCDQPGLVVDRLLTVVRDNRESWVRRYGDPEGDDKRMLGVPGADGGTVGRIPGTAAEDGASV